MKKLLASVFLCCLTSSFANAANRELTAREIRAAAGTGFIENRGQTDAKVRYYYRTRGRSVALMNDALRIEPLEITFENSQQASIVASHKLEEQYNFLRGSDRSKWNRAVLAYKLITYKELWPNVDMRVYRQGADLEQEYVIKPNGNPSAIVLNVHGAKGLKLAPDGALLIAAANGDLRQKPPLAYQHFGKERKEVKAQYKILSDNRYTFELADYDHSRPLVIDPVLLFSTYLGGIHDDHLQGIDFDSKGNAYIVGWSASEDFPVTGSAFQPERKDLGSYEYDAVLVKLSPSGNLLYSTFIGGSGNDYGGFVQVTDTGAVWMTGQIGSSDWPVTDDASQAEFGGCYDLVLTRVNNDGSDIEYSTYYGGSGSCIGDSGNDFASNFLTDADGFLYINGSTGSPDFPVTDGAFQTTYGGANLDGYAAKFSADGKSVIYSTFIGGNGEDRFLGDIDGAGRAHLTGRTRSSNLPMAENAFNDTRAGGSDSVYLVLSADGSALEYSTLLGGSDDEFGTGLVVDDSGSAYIAGVTESIDFPVTAGAFQSTFDGTNTAWLLKINADGEGPIFSTALGPNAVASGLIGDTVTFPFLALNSDQQPVVVGTAAAGYPTTLDAIRTEFAGNNEGFLSIVSANGTGLEYSTYLGGVGTDNPIVVAVNPAGDIYVTGSTSSSDFPITETAIQPEISTGDGQEAFVLVLGGGSISRVKPESGGNNGGVTIKVTALGIQEDAVFTLRQGETTIAADEIGIADDLSSISGVFNLNGAPNGAYEVRIENPDGSRISLADGFTVEDGGAPEVSAEVIGRQVIRTNTESIFQLNVRNTGNQDAYWAYVFVSLPKTVTVKPLFNFTIPIPDVETGVDAGDLPRFVTSEAGEDQVLALFYPYLPAGYEEALSLAVTAPSGDFDFSATVAGPAFQSVADMEAAIDRIADSENAVQVSAFETRGLLFPDDVLDPCLRAVIGYGINLLPLGRGLGGVGQYLKLNPVRRAVKGAWFAGFGTYAQNTTGEQLLSATLGSDTTDFWIGMGFAIAGTAATIAFPPAAAIVAGANIAYATYSFIQSLINDCPPFKPKPPKKTPVKPKNSIDPNDKSGPVGVSAGQWIEDGSSVTYQISFENKPSAELPAATVTITDALDPEVFDFDSINFISAGFGEQMLDVNQSGDQFSGEVDLRPDQELIVELSGGLARETGIITWTFRTIDPATGIAPADPTVGFLPPNVTTPEGDGRVVFSIGLKPGLTTGTAVTNQAVIVFDENDPIVTPVWSNKVFTRVGTVLTLEPASLLFKKGAKSKAQTVAISNPAGGEAVLVQDITPPAQFVLSGTDNCSYTVLEGGQQCTFAVGYDPDKNKAAGGSLTVANTGGTDPLTLELRGKGKAGRFKSKTKKIKFKPQTVGTGGGSKTITFKNTRGKPVSVSNVITPEDFAVTSNGCFEAVAPKKSCKIQLNFSPLSAGKKKGRVAIFDLSGTTVGSIKVNGTAK